MSVPTAEGNSWLGIAEAVTEAGVSVRTMHRWIADGAVKSALFPDGRRRIDPASLPRPPAPVGHAPANGAANGAANGSEASALEIERLKGRVEGAQTAAKIHSRRAEEAREEGARVEALMREIKLKLEEENAYLREQLDRKSDAEKELRTLLYQSELNVGRLTEKILALPGEKPRPWWMFWRRG